MGQRAASSSEVQPAEGCELNLPFVTSEGAALNIMRNSAKRPQDALIGVSMHARLGLTRSQYAARRIQKLQRKLEVAQKAGSRRRTHNAMAAIKRWQKVIDEEKNSWEKYPEHQMLLEVTGEFTNKKAWLPITARRIKEIAYFNTYLTAREVLKAFRDGRSVHTSFSKFELVRREG